MRKKKGPPPSPPLHFVTFSDRLGKVIAHYGPCLKEAAEGKLLEMGFVQNGNTTTRWHGRKEVVAEVNLLADTMPKFE